MNNVILTQSFVIYNHNSSLEIRFQNSTASRRHKYIMTHIKSEEHKSITIIHLIQNFDGSFFHYVTHIKLMLTSKPMDSKRLLDIRTLIGDYTRRHMVKSRLKFVDQQFKVLISLFCCKRCNERPNFSVYG